MYHAEAIVRVGGEIHDYRGKNQLRIKTIRVAKSEEGIAINDLVPSSATPKEQLYEELTQFFFDIKNQISHVSHVQLLKSIRMLF